MIKKFYEETGMYIDWQQLDRLPEIDTLIDIGVGVHGTEDLYNRFKNAKLILIDPIDEAKEYAHKLSKKREVNFFQNALGRKDGIEKEMKLQKDKGFSSFLEISEINMKDDYVEKRKLIIKKLDTIIDKKEELGKIGIKIDTEGFELDVILGATETLKHSKFVIAEVRHNHESLKEVYKLQEFMDLMSKNNFSLSMIL
ncbi:FkbM family methyltransferase, partial [Candidatus Pelagibacter sp.]|nr:FkbM family methyltransferase [Candidatus Pelagibacter sp.]